MTCSTPRVRSLMRSEERPCVLSWIASPLRCVTQFARKCVLFKESEKGTHRPSAPRFVEGTPDGTTSTISITMRSTTSSALPPHNFVTSFEEVPPCEEHKKPN